MAADVMARAGRSVVVIEGKPSVGRKFLMAGKSGLNLTKDEEAGRFVSAYGAAADWLADAGRDGARGGQGLGRGSGPASLYRIIRAGVPRGDEGKPASPGLDEARWRGGQDGLALDRLG